jgi:large subunit ribosomal protein L19
MTNALIAKVSKPAKETNHPAIEPGDTIRVHVKIKEGDKERLQAFEGTVIARHNSGIGETITVRKISFAIHAPVIDKIELIRTGKVRRAKLYYLRGLKGKAARLKERETYQPKASAPKA